MVNMKATKRRYFPSRGDGPPIVYPELVMRSCFKAVVPLHLQLNGTTLLGLEARLRHLISLNFLTNGQDLSYPIAKLYPELAPSTWCELIAFLCFVKFMVVLHSNKTRTNCLAISSGFQGNIYDNTPFAIEAGHSPLISFPKMARYRAANVVRPLHALEVEFYPHIHASDSCIRPTSQTINKVNQNH
jgi:hypothetical protein